MAAEGKPLWIRWWHAIPLRVVDLSCALAWSAWIVYQLYVYRDSNTVFLAAAAAPMVFISLAYFTRVPPRARADRPAEILVPVVAALLPHAIVWQPVAVSETQREIANIIMAVGFLGTAIGYGTLQKSFSVLVDARPPVTTGPYRFLRHPIYLAQFLVFGAATWRGLSVETVVLYLIFVALQNWRARMEERKLTENFTDYPAHFDGLNRWWPRLRSAPEAKRANP